MNKQQVLDKLQQLVDKLHHADSMIRTLSEADHYIRVPLEFTEAERDNYEVDVTVINNFIKKIEGQQLDFKKNMESLLNK